MKMIFMIAMASLLLASGKDASVKNNKTYPTVDEKDLHGLIRTTLDSPNPTKAQLERRAKSLAIIQDMNLPYLDELPVIEDESTITPRTKEEIIQRCLAVAMCALKGETNDQALLEKVIQQYSVSRFFSPKEQQFIQNPHPEEQERLNFAWGYERVHVLLWALGYIEHLKPPHQICDVPNEMGIIWKEGAVNFSKHATLRPFHEVLDMADLYYRLHWAAIELRLQGKTSEYVDEEIVMERHYALNWLIRYMDQEWDDVTTDT